MVSKHMEGCSTSLLLGKFKSKSQWHTISHLLGCLLSKEQEITNICEDVEKLGQLFTVGANVKDIAVIENSHMVPKRINNRITM